MKKKVLRHKKRCGASERKLIEMRSNFGSCRTKSIRKKWPMQKWQHNFSGCRQEKKEEAVMHASQAVDCCLEDGGTYFRQESRSGEVRVRCCVQNFPQETRGLHPSCGDVGRKGGRRNTNESKTKASCQRQVGAMKALQRAVWSLIFLGIGVHLVNAEEQGSQVQQRMSEKDFNQNFPSRRPMEASFWNL